MLCRRAALCDCAVHCTDERSWTHGDARGVALVAGGVLPLQDAAVALVAVGQLELQDVDGRALKASAPLPVAAGGDWG